MESAEHGGEGGLLGLAYQDPYLYAYSTGAEGNRVQRMELRGSSGALSVSDAETVIENLPAGRVHNGGRLAFGPDRMLYVTVGDASSRQLAQDRQSLGGKILRLTPEGGANYGWPEVEGIAEDGEFTNPVQQRATDEASPSGLAVHEGRIFIANLRGERLRVIETSNLGSSTEYFTGGFGRLHDVAAGAEGQLWLLTNNTDGRGSPHRVTIGSSASPWRASAKLSLEYTHVRMML
ncbi:PQQ-dependent sugar dehydrogenase [Glutamicibacter nicotianae]